MPSALWSIPIEYEPVPWHITRGCESLNLWTFRNENVCYYKN